MTSNGYISLGYLDYLVFIGFIVLTSIVGYYAGRGEQADTTEYFLAGKKLPWYVVGGSYIITNISTEQLIGMVGGAYIFGITLALWEWLNAFTFLFLIFLFIPFLISSKIVTIPQFLERRYSRSVRQIFAVFTVIANIVIFMAAVLYSGGLALNAFTGWDLTFCIIATGILSGVWAIYGGLSSVAWTGLLTAFVVIAGSAALTTIGLIELSGTGNSFNGFVEMINLNRASEGVWHEAVSANLQNLNSPDGYNRLSVIQGPSHSMTPWTGLAFLILSVSIWYNVLNQFIIQRVLGAKDMWHARMGVVLAGFIKVLLPYITVLPGLILFAMHPEYLLGDWGEAQRQADKGVITMAQEFLPVGLRGLLLAALFGAIQSTVSAVVNSTSTVLAFDLYRTWFRPEAGEEQLVRFGVDASVVTVALGILMAVVVTLMGGGIFQYVQTLNAFVAPPFAAIFLLGLLWRKANSTGAILAIAGGFLVGVSLKICGALFDLPGWFYPFGNQGAMIWISSMLCCIVGSKLGNPNRDLSEISDILILRNPRILRQGLGDRWYKSVYCWSAGFLILNVALMVIFTGVFFPI